MLESDLIRKLNEANETMSTWLDLLADEQINAKWKKRAFELKQARDIFVKAIIYYRTQCAELECKNLEQSEKPVPKDAYRYGDRYC